MITGEKVIGSKISLQYQLHMNGTERLTSAWIPVFDKAGEHHLTFDDVGDALEYANKLKKQDRRRPNPAIAYREYRIIREVLSVVAEVPV